MKRTNILKCVAGVAMAASLMLALAGCGSSNMRFHVPLPVPAETPLTREALTVRLVAQVAGMDTVLAHVEGSLVVQGFPVTKDQLKTPAAQELEKIAPPTYPGERTEELSGARLFARRIAGEEPRTRFLAEFPRVGTALSLLSIGDRFWVRSPLPNLPVVTGDFNDSASRPKGPPTMRPQDLGMLLFCDDLMPVNGKWNYTSYMEVWPNYYILHILHTARSPEVIYSRLWIDRQTLTVVYHQIFDPDGTVVAEARLSDYRDFSTVSRSRGRSMPKGARLAENSATFTMPVRAVIFWPKENMALDLRISRVVANEPIEDQYFSPPDATKIRVVEIPPAETTKE